jgi:hypothetical protein
MTIAHSPEPLEEILEEAEDLREPYLETSSSPCLRAQVAFSSGVFRPWLVRTRGTVMPFVDFDGEPCVNQKQWRGRRNSKNSIVD